MKKAILLTIFLTLVATEALRAVETLPQTLPYQQQLRRFMATLKAEDFQPVHKDLKVVPFAGDADERLRMWILSLQPPAVGRKRNYSSVMIKASHFTLDTIEGAKAIMRPPAYPEPLVDLDNGPAREADCVFERVQVGFAHFRFVRPSKMCNVGRKCAKPSKSDPGSFEQLRGGRRFPACFLSPGTTSVTVLICRFRNDGNAYNCVAF